jgi:Short C-terminal domain/Bacterial PH domain
MGFMDKVREQAAAAKKSMDERNERMAEERRQAADLQAVQREQLAKDREAAFTQTKASCALPLDPKIVILPGGIQVFNDEFVVSVARDWGWSTQKLALTTHRVVWSKGVINTDQKSIYLTDIRDVRYHKPFMGAGSIILETAGGRSIEGLPAASNGAVVRDRLMAMIHWARQRAQQPAAAPAAPAPAAPDRLEQLKRLGDLKTAGVLSEEEFQAEKAKLLAS